MTNETYAALWGAAVGGVITFLTTYFADFKKKADARKVAISLFKYLNDEFKSANAQPKPNEFKRSAVMNDGVGASGNQGAPIGIASLLEKLDCAVGLLLTGNRGSNCKSWRPKCIDAL